MDEFDRAALIEEHYRAVAVQAVRNNLQKIPANTTGVCWTCEEPLPDRRRWCNAACRDAYDE